MLTRPVWLNARLLLAGVIALLLALSYLVDLSPPHAPQSAPESNVATSAAASTQQDLWTSTRTMSARENAEAHFHKHGREFGFKSADEYIAAARAFLFTDAPDTLTKKQADGDTVRYRPATAEFGVMNRRGVPRTYFKLDPRIHGYPDNDAYFAAQ